MQSTLELVTAFLFVGCYLSFGLSIATVKWLFFSSILVVLIVTDYRERILPDAVNWFGVGLGIAFAIRVPPADGIARMLLGRQFGSALPQWIPGVLDAILGAILCGGLLWAAAIFYRLVRARVGIGFRDVNIMF